MEDKHIEEIFNCNDSKRAAIKLIEGSLLMKVEQRHLDDYGQYQLYELLDYTGDGDVAEEYTDLFIKMLLWLRERNEKDDFLTHTECPQSNPLKLLTSLIKFFRGLEGKGSELSYHWLHYQKLQFAPYSESFTKGDLEELMLEYDIDPLQVTAPMKAAI